MRSVFAYIWQRRWFRLLIVGTVVCGLPMLHPFIRQAAFGPTIEGIPWCVWEDEIRQAADPGRGRDSWVRKALQKLGFVRTVPVLPVNSSETLPLLLHMANDHDVKVRRHVLMSLGRWMKTNEAEVMAVYRRSLQDDDPHCRITAARQLWKATQDAELEAWVLSQLGHKDIAVRRDVAYLLSEMAAKNPELFEPLAKLALDTDSGLRCAAVDSMQHFGKRGVPIVGNGLLDSSVNVRQCAVSVSSCLGKDAKELIPILVTMRGNLKGRSRDHVEDALHEIDPERFPTLAGNDK